MPFLKVPVKKSNYFEIHSTERGVKLYRRLPLVGFEVEKLLSSDHGNVVSNIKKIQRRTVKIFDDEDDVYLMRF